MARNEVNPLGWHPLRYRNVATHLGATHDTQAMTGEERITLLGYHVLQHHLGAGNWDSALIRN